MAGAAHEWIELAAQRLQAAGYRRGGARDAVLDVLGRRECAVSALDVQEELRRSDRAIGIASIYRAFEQLSELRLVSRVEVGDGTTRFEARRPDGHHHHHVICDTCGKVEPFADTALERAIARVSERVSFRVDEHEIVLHGSCRACAPAS
jgi:Fur family ferric uptake transcriptional regulator